MIDCNGHYTLLNFGQVLYLFPNLERIIIFMVGISLMIAFAHKFPFDGVNNREKSIRFEFAVNPGDVNTIRFFKNSFEYFSPSYYHEFLYIHFPGEEYCV